MSKEYLTGEEKERIIEKIRLYIGHRMDDKEIINNLNDNHKIKISERTLRRYKQEIREKSGNNLEQIYTSDIISDIVNDICTYESLQRKAWEAFTRARTPIEQIRALSLVRNATGDKIRLLKNIPTKFHKSNLEHNKFKENPKQPNNPEKTPKETFKEVKAVIKDNKKFLEELQKVSGTKIHL